MNGNPPLPNEIKAPSRFKYQGMVPAKADSISALGHRVSVWDDQLWHEGDVVSNRCSVR
jgi:hypothetical protein